MARIVELSCVICYRRIQKSLPNALELLELCADKEFPRIGLRITFPDALSASAFVCKNEVLLIFVPFVVYIFNFEKFRRTFVFLFIVPPTLVDTSSGRTKKVSLRFNFGITSEWYS